MARLHDDDPDEEGNAFRRGGKKKGIDLKAYEEEMKVFDMENSDEEGVAAAIAEGAVKKREQKGAEKGSGTVIRKQRGEAGAKVNRLVRIIV